MIRFFIPFFSISVSLGADLLFVEKRFRDQIQTEELLALKKIAEEFAIPFLQKSHLRHSPYLIGAIYKDPAASPNVEKAIESRRWYSNNIREMRVLSGNELKEKAALYLNTIRILESSQKEKHSSGERTLNSSLLELEKLLLTSEFLPCKTILEELYAFQSHPEKLTIIQKNTLYRTFMREFKSGLDLQKRAQAQIALQYSLPPMKKTPSYHNLTELQT
jgi:hypothetical protein